MPIPRMSVEQANTRIKAQADVMDYSFEPLVEYMGVKQRIKCKCNVCGGEWESTFTRVVYQKCGCRGCAFDMTRYETRAKLMSKLDALSVKHSFTDKPFKYENLRQKIECKCNTCGFEWKPRADRIIEGGV